MNQNQNSRRASTPKHTRSKSLETGKCGRRNNRIPRDVCQKEPKYDPKEVRDTVRVLSPFVKLIADSGNPYARTVAHEVCKSFFVLYHPDKRPDEVIKSIDWDANSDRTTQLNIEFGRYIPKSGIRKWKSLRYDNNLVNFASCKTPIGRKQCTENRREPCSQSKPSPAERSVREPQPKNHNDFRDATDRCSRRASSNCCRSESCPKNRAHRAAGADFRLSDADNGAEFDNKQIWERFSEYRHQLEKLMEDARKKLSTISEGNTPDKTGATEVIENHTRSPPEYVSGDSEERRPAGNDNYLESYRSEQPGPDVDPVAQQLDYYRSTGNTSLPMVERQTLREPLGIGLNIEDIATNTKLLANAFAKLSVAYKEIVRKKDALKTITKNYLNFCSNPVDACPDSLDAGTALEVLSSDAPNIMKSFDPTDSNTNAFRDRDFVRLLPFFQVFHVQLRLIVQLQREECGINMLDEITSALNRVAYETGDPRLKNDLVVEHVKMVTRNTWESYFYGGKIQKMPGIPERPSQSNRLTRQSGAQNECRPCPQKMLPVSSCSRREQSRSLSCPRNNNQSRTLPCSRNQNSQSMSRSRNEQPEYSRECSRSQHQSSRSRSKRRSSGTRNESRQSCCPEESQPPCPVKPPCPVQPPCPAQPSCPVQPSCSVQPSCPVQPPQTHVSRSSTCGLQPGPIRGTPNDDSKRNRAVSCPRDNRDSEPDCENLCNSDCQDMSNFLRGNLLSGAERRASKNIPCEQQEEFQNSNAKQLRHVSFSDTFKGQDEPPC